MTLGEKIYVLRTRAGFSQETLAEKVGVSRQSVSKWETSVAIPDTEYVIKMSKIFCVSSDSLLLDKNLPEIEPERALKYVDPTAEKTLNNRRTLSVVGFVFSIVACVIGFVLCSIATRKEKKLFGACTHLTVAGLSISCALIFAVTIVLLIYSNFVGRFGGNFLWGWER